MFILVDIGGTKTRVARTNDLHTFGEPIVFKTPQPYQYALVALVEAVRKLSGDDTIDAIAVGVPGVVSRDKKSIIRAPHLQQWNTANIVDDLEKALKTTIILNNDVELVALGEAVSGAGVGAPIVAYVTVSTGVNGARIVEGMIDRTSLGFEIGGQYLTMGSDAKTLEDLVSGSAVENKYGVHPRDLGIDAPVWEELALALAYGLNNTVVHWSPHRIVLGGSMMNEIGIPIERVKFHLAKILQKVPQMPDIVHSNLADFGGLYGGMAHLRATIQ